MEELIYFVKDAVIVLAETPTSLVIALSTAIAWKSLKQSRKLSIQKNTLDFDDSHSANSELLKAYVTLRHISTSGLSKEVDSKLRDLASKKQDSSEAEAIRLILNTWERVARGVEHEVYDEEMLYRAFKSLVVQIHRKTKAYRLEAQVRTPTFYECFETMAYRWEIRYLAK
jgi:hypothetical protein